MTFQRKATGSAGEDVAVAYLERKGYVILDRNWATRLGELDIVAQDGGTLVFVEVKTFRPGGWSEGPLVNLTPAKQKQVVRAAKVYLARLGWNPYVRFDVVTVQPDAKKPVQHFEGAFSG